MESSVKGLTFRVTTLELDIEATAQTTLCHTAACAVHHTTGRYLPPTSSSRYSLLACSKSSEGCFLDLSARTGILPKVIAARLDKVVTERNACVHPDSFARLEVQVVEAVRLITHYRGLRNLYPDECWIIDNYRSMMAAFEPLRREGSA